MTILQKIQSLLTAANTKTGESDTTLTDAVQTLIDGYGQGGGGGGSGETLLASGAYTYDGSGANNKMGIPVTLSGTATRAFVVAREIPSGLARTFLWLNGNLTFVDPVGSFPTTTITRKVAANGNQSNDANTSLVLESGNIVCSAASGAYYPAAVTYDWYVWGYTT